MLGLSKRERALYEKIIEIQAEEITTLRLQLGLFSQSVAGEQPEEEKRVTDVYPDFQVSTDLEEDLEWQLESGRISLDEFEQRMRGYGIHLSPIEQT